MGGQGIIFSYIQFSAVADGLIWGNGLCRSSDTTHYPILPFMQVIEA
jgi:hypothetical protein